MVQVGLALVLLIGAGLMLRTFQNLSEVDAGFERPEEIQTVRIEIPFPMAAEAQKECARRTIIGQACRALPGVVSVAYTSGTPTRATRLTYRSRRDGSSLKTIGPGSCSSSSSRQTTLRPPEYRW